MSSMIEKKKGYERVPRQPTPAELMLAKQFGFDYSRNKPEIWYKHLSDNSDTEEQESELMFLGFYEVIYNDGRVVPVRSFWVSPDTPAMKETKDVCEMDYSFKLAKLNRDM